ncbi:MAG: methyl-accepting chemotaxis protein [Gammaproteobacteria bacterium]|nr:methyl-accepting chemotaxis protein [Gammaproteobacteria bacterium]
MTLGTRISFVAASTILLVVAVIIINARMSIAEVEERFRDEAITGKTVLWSKIISSQADHMLSNIQILNSDPEILAALKKKNKADLSANVLAVYKLLNSDKVLDRIQITDMSGDILYALPNASSGETQKNTVKAALESGNISYGVELDDNDALVISAAFPLYSKGVQIGVAVYMKNLQAALEDFKKNDNSENFIVNVDGDEIYTTQVDMFSKLRVALPELGKYSVSVGQFNERLYTIVIQPVVNSSGDAIAYLVSARDRTESYEDEQWIVAVTYSFNGMLLICTVLGLFWYLKKLTEPLVKISTAMEEIADGDGDLTQRMPATGTEELIKLARAFNKFVDKIENVVSDARVNLNSINHLARQTADGNADLARRTEAEMSNLKKASASMKAMTNSVKQTADLSEGAADISENAKSRAQDAALALTMVIGSVEMIDNGSEKMDGIIQVINEIAFQTNLLALNASIEAAHAGDKGKGFSVVASEVRNLAQRSASAAKEIGTLIRSNIENAKEGSALVEQAAEALGEMSGSIQKVAAAISEISRTCRDQANGIDQVNHVVLEIEEITQQNTSMLDRIAIASDSVDRQSNELNNMMHYFKIGQVEKDSGSDLVVGD